MTGEIYTFAYLFKIAVFGALLAFIRCGLGMLFSYIALLHGRWKLLYKTVYHIGDFILAITFLMGYLLLTYASRDGALRLIDLLPLFLFYCLFKLIFGYIFKIADNILRHFIGKIIIKPLSFLHNLLVMGITRIIKVERSNYK